MTKTRNALACKDVGRIKANDNNWNQLQSYTGNVNDTNMTIFDIFLEAFYSKGSIDPDNHHIDEVRKKRIRLEISMLNYIWYGMIALGMVAGMLTGRMEAVTKALIDSTAFAVQLCIGLLGVMCLWTGIMEIAEKAGLVEWLGKIARPALRFLFRSVPVGHPAMGAIVMNMTANFLGLGNAATPLGIQAMTELQSLNRDRATATEDMSMFLVLNTAALQLIPTTIIAVRSAAGSQNPAEIILPIWAASLTAAMVGITAAKCFAAGSRKNKSGRLTHGHF